MELFILLSLAFSCLVPLFMAAILYTPLERLLVDGRFKREWTFIATHLVSSLIIILPWCVYLMIDHYSCEAGPEDPSCRDMGSSIMLFWLQSACVVTLIISPLIAHKMYKNAS